MEIGCGKGAFLRKLVQADGSGNRGVGLDPTYEGELESLGGRLRFEKRFYGPECTDIPVDVVGCRHVLEHVPDPMGMLHSLRESLTRSPNAMVFFETPCVSWILKNRVIWDFFYEHCSLFSVESLSHAFSLAGFEVREVRHVFGGQYLWLEAGLADGGKPVTFDPTGIVESAIEFSGQEERFNKSWAEIIHRLTESGKVAIWGAGAKGVTFANLIDPEGRYLDCVVDLNPSKQGRFIPGTGHPIVNPRQLTARKVRSVVIMNENYYHEICKFVTDEGISLELIPAVI